MYMRAGRILIAATLVAGTFALAQTNSTASASQASPAPAAAKWPTVDGTGVLPNFRFGTGETLPQLKLHYLTLGSAHRNAAGHVDNAVLLLHGTGGNVHSLLIPVFSDVLFVPGGVLDVTKYFLIFTDDIGHGDSSRPSDGLHAHFPAY